MTLKQLEEKQVGLYLIALVIGGGLGLLWPAAHSEAEALIEPVLGILLYTMFAQIPFLHLRDALSHRRFMAALLVANFLLVPALVWLLTRFLPNQPPLLLGVFLVLLTPCIDYVIVFTHMGRGDAKLVLAATPMLLLVQMLLLPFYLWLFMGSAALDLMSAGPFLRAFVVLIAIPLTLALLTELWAGRRRTGQAWLGATAWLPVPMMALTLLVIVASQITKVYTLLPVIAWAVPVYVAFMAIMPFISRLTARAFRLETGAARALVFTASTRNSLVVLPLALALPEQWRTLVAVVIVTQTLVELVGELIYVRVVPTVVVPDTPLAGARPPAEPPPVPDAGRRQ